MNPPPPDELIARLRRQPAGAVLLDRLGPDTPVQLVGGAVRDLLLGLAPTDFDLVVDGDPSGLARQLDPAAQVHDRFGTATFRVDGFSFDIARTRRERYPHPGALPEVQPAGLNEDLLRRDFTVNAIAMALAQPVAGAISAAPRAMEDLDQRRLRVLHADSFIDDPTRLLRLLRYAGRLEFEIEPETAKLAAAATAGSALTTVSGARIGTELKLLARERDPVTGLAALGRFDLAAAIHSGFGLTDETRARRALAILRSAGRRDLLALSLAMENVDAGERPELLDRLAFEAPARKTIVVTSDRSERLASALAGAGTASAIAEAVADAPPELVAAAGARGPEQAARRWLEELSAVRLEIDGADLLAAGVAEGPAIGEALHRALLAKLDGRVHGREQELACALRAATGNK